MENISRRKLINTLLFTSLVPISSAFAFNRKRINISLPDKPFEYFVKKGKEKGGIVLVIGGIHGNEIGAYKAADILVDVEVKKGTLIVVPRSNFTSILANVRGYNGDMNRKFAHISPKDPDYFFVKKLKKLILEFKPDVVLSLHDGYGFHILNPKFWGQSIVIDEYEYKNFPLFKIANFVACNVNKKIKEKKHKIPVYNTKTFSSNKHKEQRKALTGWCLKHNIPAFCLEASKQLPSIQEKVKTHFYMISEFFKLYNVEISPDFDYLISNMDSFLTVKNPKIKLKVNNRLVYLTNKTEIKVPEGSKIQILSFEGARGLFTVADGINLNIKNFFIRNYITIHFKNDYQTLFNFRIRRT